MILAVGKSISIKHRNTSLKIGFSAIRGIMVTTNHEFKTIHAIEQSKSFLKLISPTKHEVAADNKRVFRGHALIILLYDSLIHLFNTLKTTSFPDKFLIVIEVIVARNPNIHFITLS